MVQCIECGKKININKYKSQKFCSSFCCMQNYQKRKRKIHECLACGKECYSQHRICLVCSKLNRLELRRRLKMQNNNI